MKAYKLAFFMLLPVLVGVLYSLAMGLPFIGWLLFWMGPFAMGFFWFKIGGVFAAHMKNAAISALLANALGIVSLPVFYWQRHLSARPDTALTALSQAFTAPMALVGRMLMPEDATTVWTRLAELAVMVVIFLAGFVRYRYFKKDEG